MFRGTLLPPIFRGRLLSGVSLRRQGLRYASDLSRDQIKPPALFQDVNRQPVPYHVLQQQQQQQQQHQQQQQILPPHQPQQHQQSTYPFGREEKLSLVQLFSNRATREAAWRLFLLLSLTQVVVFYVCSNAILDELEDTESKLTDLWDYYERKDISQTVMAVHIGQLKQQLINVGAKPVTTQQALTVAQHLLSFARDKETGNLMIYVDPHSQIYRLVPFSYEYDIQKVPRLDSAVDKTWEEFNRGPKEVP